MNLQFLEPEDPRWEHFLSLHEDATIFHSPQWIANLAQTYAYRPFILAGTDAGGNLLTGLPILEVANIVGKKRWVSLPFSDHLALLATRPEDGEDLIEALWTGVMRGSFPDISIRNPLRTSRAIYQESDSVLHLLSLEADAEKTLAKMHPMHRRNIHKAQKSGLEVGFFHDKASLDQYFTLHTLTRQRQGVPVQPKKYFDNLWRNLIDQNLGFVALARKGDEAIAGALFLTFQGSLTYKYGASLKNAWSLRPNHLLFAEVIRWGCREGYRVLDFGKTDSDQAGLREFKSHWGATEIPLTYSEISRRRPARSLASNKTLLMLMKNIIQKSPPVVCRCLGEILYQHMG